MNQTNIIIKLQVEGFHSWPQAAELLPEVGFLSAKHRHIFHIVAKKKVTHSDRDVEIILFKRKITDFLYFQYGKNDHSLVNVCEFGPMSCEMIAEVLLKKFDLQYCSVLEDNENGAEVFCLPKQNPRDIVFGPGEFI